MNNTKLKVFERYVEYVISEFQSEDMSNYTILTHGRRNTFIIDDRSGQISITTEFNKHLDSMIGTTNNYSRPGNLTWNEQDPIIEKIYFRLKKKSRDQGTSNK